MPDCADIKYKGNSRPGIGNRLQWDRMNCGIGRWREIICQE